MATKSTTIKERILQLSEEQPVSKTKFFTELGQSYSNFTGRNKKTAIPSDFLSRLLNKYPNCNSHWLLTGKGEMISSNKSKTIDELQIVQNENNNLKADIIELKKQIAHLRNITKEGL